MRPTQILARGSLLSLLFVVAASKMAVAGVVYVQDFEGAADPVPSEWSSGAGVFGASTGAFRNYTGFDDGFLVNSTVPPQPTVLVLENLPPHDRVSVGFLLALINSWDGYGAGAGPDSVVVRVDGEVIFGEAFGLASGSTTYRPNAKSLISNAAYNLHAEPRLFDIPHSNGTLTISWTAAGPNYEGGQWESFAIDKVIVTLDTAVPLQSVQDVVNDQGGAVKITWAASIHDTEAPYLVEEYRIWRSVPPNPAAKTVLSPQQPQVDVGGYAWELVGGQASGHLPLYSYVAHTTSDSIAGSNPLTAFMVEARSADGSLWWFSNPDSGYSVDNLAPPQPNPFVGVYRQVGVALHWGENGAPDLAEFRLYRGASADFTPAAGNLVTAQPDTGFFDPLGSTQDYYKLSAVDVHGNESTFALVSPDLATPVLVSLQSTEVGPGRVRLVWHVGSVHSVTVYKRSEDTDWDVAAELEADGEGRVTFEDGGLAAGRYGYRLGVAPGSNETFAGEVWVEVPSLDLALVVAPNPAVGSALTVQLTLPAGGPAMLELLDVAGRSIATRDIGSLGAGKHTVRWADPVHLAPGIYVVRLRHDGDSRIARLAIIE